MAFGWFAVVMQGSAQTQVIFSENFDGVLPPEFSPGVATNTPVQGYAGLGPTGYQFGGSFLRSPTGNSVTLTLTNLPPHASLNLAMLIAAIDSLDGTGTFPSGDFFQIKVGSNAADGVEVFRESFANALLSQIQSYVPPPGGELARHVDLGFSGPGGFYTDSAYNFAVDSRFSNLVHTASSAVISFLMEGPGVQSLDDESWAIDNLIVSVNLAGSDEPPVITQIKTLTNEVTVVWSAITNRNYIVQSCTNLATPVWTDILPAIPATDISANYTEPLGTGQRYYRVKLLAP